MGDLFPAPVTPENVANANAEKLSAFGLATAVVAGVTGLNYALNAPGGPLVQVPLKTGLTGIDVKPTPSGRAAVTIPRASFLTGLLPAPVGYIPGEAYGLPPDFYIQELGRPVGSKPLGFDVTDERKQVALIQRTADLVASRAFGGSAAVPGQYSPTSLTIPPGPIPLTPGDVAFLQRVPAGLSNLTDVVLPQLESRLSDLRPGAPGNPVVGIPEFGGPGTPVGGVHNPTITSVALSEVDPELVAFGSVQPSLNRPVNGRAIANARDATGIRRDLATERFDP